jgi:hypothetical protein
MKGMVSFVLSAMLIGIFGCGGYGYHSTDDATKALQPFATSLGIHWPSPCLTQQGATCRYHAVLDGGSDNYLVIARLVVSNEVYLDWRTSVTNVLEYLVGLPALPDPERTRQFSWWKPPTVPSEKLTKFMGEYATRGDGFGRVNVYAVSNQDLHWEIYIEAMQAVR